MMREFVEKWLSVALTFVMLIIALSHAMKGNFVVVVISVAAWAVLMWLIFLVFNKRGDVRKRIR
jgi:hypothetical protein